jgi:hypothetical protein
MACTGTSNLHLTLIMLNSAHETRSFLLLNILNMALFKTSRSKDFPSNINSNNCYSCVFLIVWNHVLHISVSTAFQEKMDQNSFPIINSRHNSNSFLPQSFINFIYTLLFSGIGSVNLLIGCRNVQWVSVPFLLSKLPEQCRNLWSFLHNW